MLSMLMTVQYLSGAQLCNSSGHGCCCLSFFIFHAESCGNQISLFAEFCLDFSNMSIKRLYSFISSLRVNCLISVTFVLIPYQLGYWIYCKVISLQVQYLCLPLKSLVIPSNLQGSCINLLFHFFFIYIPFFSIGSFCCTLMIVFNTIIFKRIITYFLIPVFCNCSNSVL